MMKFHNLHVKAREIVEKGGIGQVNDVRAQFSCWYPDIPGAWRQKNRLAAVARLWISACIVSN